jgi:UDP:flavonoid glycosyltransferase YjiC (YdhE family)
MSHPKRVLLAWQIGDGRGHISKLRVIGESLTAAGLQCSAALTDLEFSAELKHVAPTILGMPRLPYFHGWREQASHPPAATYGEFLGDLGFASSRIIAEHLRRWRDVIEKTRADVVIAEQAPIALLAARSLSIPCVSLGTTYTLPPTNLDRFPVLLDEFHRCRWSEQEMCQAISEAIAPFGLPPLTRLAELYTADIALSVGIKLLDPYNASRREERISPDIGSNPLDEPWRRERNEVFAYLSTGNRFDSRIIEALAKLKLPLRVYAAGITQEWAARFRQQGIQIENRPVRPFQIMRRSRVLFHSGSYGTMCLGIYAGIPQVAVPQQLEQLFNARKLQEVGAGWCIEPDEGPVHFDQINEAYESAERQTAAIDLALQTRKEFAYNPAQISCARILKLIRDDQ